MASLDELANQGIQQYSDGYWYGPDPYTGEITRIAAPAGYADNPGGTSKVDMAVNAAGIERPGFWNSVMADTVGIGWRAVSGTVDPWTKAEVIDNATFGALGSEGDKVIQTAGGAQAFQQQGEAAATAVLLKDKADPSQFWDGVKGSLGKFGLYSGALVVGVVLVVVAFVVLTRPRV